MRIALVGQPNCGKSTLFNAIAGYKTEVGNFPGTTIEFTRCKVGCEGHTFELVDVPGLYSLETSGANDLHALDQLAKIAPDVIVNVADASILSRSLELTLELLEIEFPLVLCLNMMDEAAHKGISIDADRLAAGLGIPVVPTIASRGQGIPELFKTALQTACDKRLGRPLGMSRDVESAIGELAAGIAPETAARVGLPPRFIALQWLQRDEVFGKRLGDETVKNGALIQRLAAELETAHGRPSDVVIGSERHALAMNLFESTSTVLVRTKKTQGVDWDRYAMHPVWGFLLLATVLFFFFYAVFGFGRLLEPPLLDLFARLQGLLDNKLPPASLIAFLMKGLIQGFSGGIGIVLPYLFPFLLALALLEDVGYLPRAAFLMDTLMHRIGLHGKAVIPFVLGYGCTVPAIMSVRILETRRDRFVAALLVNLIPCAARSTVIFAVVGFFVGGGWALAFYALDLLVIALAGRLFLKFLPGELTGLILEIPSWKKPALATVLHKVWFRLREFIVVAWPILIVGSVLLSLLEYYRLDDAVNGLLSPLTSGLLGLPAAVGITLVFGILRKELTIVMLIQALGTANLALVMTTEQMVVFTAFILFYIPCLATLTMVHSAFRGKGVLASIAFTTGVATLVALLFRLGFTLFG
ncbi:MAG: ferrous iron transport protein B [Myxococcales bacterium]|nr:ferrous iron transport protein B [Myxococcales bacterium]